jgi:hypothetical protein
MSAWTALKPVDGAGTWRHTARHSDLQLTLLGTFVVCLLMAVAFLLLLKGGRAVMCATHTGAQGKPTISYCEGFVPASEQR